MASSHCTEREGTGSEGGAANDQVKAKKKKWQHKRTEYKIGKGLSHFLTRLDTHTHTHTRHQTSTVFKPEAYAG